MSNEAFERYNVRVEIPVSIILETIFSTDNQDVESLSRWAYKYGFVDLIEKEDGHKYYQLQKDYTKQSLYVVLDKEERKQYEYEDTLLDRIEKANNILDDESITFPTAKEWRQNLKNILNGQEKDNKDEDIKE